MENLSSGRGDGQSEAHGSWVRGIISGRRLRCPFPALSRAVERDGQRKTICGFGGPEGSIFQSSSLYFLLSLLSQGSSNS